jgi:TolB protein
VGKGRWPAWSPSQSLAYTGCDRSGRFCGIFSDSNPDDPEPAVRLTADVNDIGLAWSPDGMYIAYMSNHSGNWEVYTVNIWGGVRLLTNDPANDGLPAWAPDGSALAFISDRDGAWGIYLMQPDGSQQRKLLDLGPVYPDWLNQRLAWAP